MALQGSDGTAASAVARPGLRRALGAVVLACGLCNAQAATAQGAAPAAAKPPATVTASPRSAPEWSEYHGAVASRHAVPLIALVPGRVKVVHVSAGQRVRKGQVLVELESDDLKARLEAAESRLASARAVLDEARSEYERLDKLAAKGHVANQRLEKSRAHLLAAQAAEAEARAGVSEARNQLGYAVLKSPIDGIVTDKRVDPGDISTPGLPAEAGLPTGRTLLTIYDPNALWFEARIPERYATNVKVGAPVRVTIPPARLALESSFVEVLPLVDDTTRTFKARVNLPADSALKLGMLGRAGFVTGERTVIELPESAVVERGQLDALFVAADGKARMRVVRVGKRQNGQVEILSGIKAGEQVLVSPRANLRDGDAL